MPFDFIGCANGVMGNGSELVTEESDSCSSRLRYIHLPVNTRDLH